MKDQIIPNGAHVPPDSQPSAPRAVNVEIGELILDGFGPVDARTMDSRPVDSPPFNARRPNARRPDPARPYSASAAEALRRELVRELADAGEAGPEAEQLAATIADAVFRQLSAPPRRGGAR